MRDLVRLWGRACCFFAILWLLTACSSTGRQIVGALLSGELTGTKDRTVDAQLDSRLQYLRVEVNGSTAALMVLGYVDNHADGSAEVWYSARGEVIRLKYGRIVSTAGLPLDWTKVWFNQTPPPWEQVTAEGASLTRWRDQRPGYSSGIESTLLLRRVDPPSELSGRVRIARLSELRWYEESEVGGGGNGLPPSFFALGRYRGEERIVYSTQCLSTKLCLTMQLWPMTEEFL